jgi:Domain of unknown function (DUF397)
MFISEAGTKPACQIGDVVGQEPAVDHLTWHRRCESGACVEIAVQGEAVMVRSSTAPEVMIILTHAEWREFLTEAKQGLFDRL